MVNPSHRRARGTQRTALLSAALVVAVLLPARDAAGQASPDDAINELRVRTPSGANDERTVDDWLNAQIGRLGAAGHGPAARRAFMDSLQGLRDAPDTTSGFRDTLALRLGAVAAVEFGKGAALALPVADTIARALIATEDPQTVEGLKAALSFPNEVVRYLGAEGLHRIRDSVPANERRPILDALKQRGVQEPNDVVTDRIYMAMSFRTPSTAVIDAITDVLAARVAQYRRTQVLGGSAEAGVMEYLAGVPIPQAQGVKIVRELAPLLRIDVEQYAAGGHAPNVKVEIELRVDACEGLLSQITGVNPSDTVRGAMQAGGPAVVPTMQLALIGWIGSAQADGVLTASPWSVPRLAP